MILFFLILSQFPGFALKDLDGNEVVLDSLLEEGPVVVGFWSTNCKYCVKELDTFKKLNEEFKVRPDTGSVEVKQGGRNVTFVGINENGARTQRKVPLLVKSRKWDFLVLYDDNRKIMQSLQVRLIPQTFIIGKDREILYQHIGFREKDEEVLRKKLESLLKPVSNTLESGKSKESE